MKADNIDIVESPHSPDRVRLIGKVSYDTYKCAPELYWFDVPKKYKNFISLSGNPWLVCLLPLAMTRGESLEIAKPVDATLLKNVKKIMKIWKCWYPELNLININAELAANQEFSSPKDTAAFFSGGIDSFFTVLRHNTMEDFEEKANIDDLLTVWGFDILLSKPEEFYRMRSRLQSAASGLKKQLIDIATNLRETKFSNTNWGALSHGCALASIAHVLEEKYSGVLIASSHGYAGLFPWGSHVITDPLFSSFNTKIIHDGSEFTRLEKAELIANSPIALESLHVCWRSYSDKNCGKCSKCYRTMMMLDLYGALNKCTTFSRDDYKQESVSRVFTPKLNTQENMHHMYALALKKGEKILAKQILKSLNRSTRINKYLSLPKFIRRRLGNKRVLWRLGEYASGLMERIILRNAIT